MFGLLFGSAVISFFLFALLSSRIYDISWDGQTYHAEGIVQLADGWNPFLEPPRVGHASGTYSSPFHLSFSSKDAWICAAAVYKFSGSFEVGKAVQLSHGWNIAATTPAVWRCLDRPASKSAKVEESFVNALRQISRFGTSGFSW